MKFKLSLFIILFCILTVPLWATKVPVYESLFEGDPLVIVIQDLAMETETNIILDQAVTGMFTGDVRASSVEAALDILLAGTEYKWIKTPYYYLIAPPEVADRRLEIQTNKSKYNLLGPIVDNEYQADPVQMIIADLSIDTDTPIRVDPNVCGVVSVRLDGIPLEIALDSICAGIRADWVKEDDGYRVFPLAEDSIEALEPESLAVNKAIDYFQCQLTLVLRELAIDTDTNILVDHEVRGFYSGDLHGSSVDLVLDSLLGVTGYTWIHTPHYILVAPPEVAQRRLQIQTMKPTPDQGCPMVDGEYDQESVPLLLSDLAMDTGKGIYIHPDVNGVASVRFNDIPLESALDCVCACIRADWIKKGEVYGVYPLDE